MLTNSREFQHPTGYKLKTPLLIPSFSSKGFNFQKKEISGEKKKVSELYEVILVCKELLTESMLVSAYDLYYGFLPDPSMFHCTEFTIIDSGGYETSNSYDFSGINRSPHDINSWKPDFLEEVILNWPEEFPAILVNYDHGQERLPLSDQISKAKIFFKKCGSGKFCDFLIKPETEDQNFIKIDSVQKKVYELHSFDIIGVTEKEIGNSILERMINIHKIREALNAANLDRPIHIFGSLDPITSILYFFAGAEIFDGLTWLKFSYHNGIAMYNHNYAVLNEEIGIHTKDTSVKIKSLTGNINYLDKLKYVMMDFAATGDFKVFSDIGDAHFVNVLEKSYNRFKNSIKV